MTDSHQNHIFGSMLTGFGMILLITAYRQPGVDTTAISLVSGLVLIALGAPRTFPSLRNRGEAE